MRRHQRHRDMWDNEVAKFENDATEFHRKLVQHLHSLRPSGPHYKIILKLSDHTHEAIEEITGKQASWIRGTMASAPANPRELKD